MLCVSRAPGSSRHIAAQPRLNPGSTPAQPGPTRLTPPPESPFWGFLGALARPGNPSFLQGKLTFRAKMTVGEIHAYRAIKTALEIRQQLPQTKIDLFQTRIIKQNSKNSAIGAPKLERELRKPLKNADSSSGSESRWPKTRTPARFALLNAERANKSLLFRF